MVDINKVIYVGNYLPNGLTKNIRRNKQKSPLENIELVKVLMYKEWFEKKIIYKIRKVLYE